MAAEHETTLHQALADRSRAGLLARLRSVGTPLDTNELARASGLHANTVRWHLTRLERAGLVRSFNATGGRPGRPRRLFEATVTGADAAPNEHRLLSTALVGAVAAGPEPARSAELAGRSLAEAELLALPEADADDPLEALVTVLDRHGFAPTEAGSTVTMHRCPFPELVALSPAVVCGVHRGLVEGILDELGAPLELGRLEIGAPDHPCVAHLERRSGVGPS